MLQFFACGQLFVCMQKNKPKTSKKLPQKRNREEFESKPKPVVRRTPAVLPTSTYSVREVTDEDVDFVSDNKQFLSFLTDMDAYVFCTIWHD